MKEKKEKKDEVEQNTIFADILSSNLVTHGWSCDRVVTKILQRFSVGLVKES